MLVSDVDKCVIKVNLIRRTRPGFLERYTFRSFTRWEVDRSSIASGSVSPSNDTPRVLKITSQ